MLLSTFDFNSSSEAEQGSESPIPEEKPIKKEIKEENKKPTIIKEKIQPDYLDNGPISSSSSSENSESEEEDEEEEEFEVESIVKDRIFKGKRQYLLKWKGYPNSENTWENEENLQCFELIKEYQRKKNEKADTTTNKKSKEKPKNNEHSSRAVTEILEQKGDKLSKNQISRIISFKVKDSKIIYEVERKGVRSQEYIASETLRSQYPELLTDFLEESVLKKKGNK